MKTILVPIDFSDNADKAMKYAIQLAKGNGSKLILFHAFHFNISNVDENGFINNYEVDLSIQEEQEKQLKKLATKITSSHKLECESIYKQGFLIDVIETIVKNKKVDLIVMSTHGASGIEKIILGSNTADVINHAHCPVLAVPISGKYKAFKKAVFATDYHSNDLRSLNKLVEIVKSFKGEIDIIHIAQDETSYTEEEKKFNKFESKIKDKIDYKKLNFRLLYGIDTEKSLEKYIQQEAIDLVSLSTKHRGLFDRLFGKKSLTKKLVYHTHIPLLAFHTK